jgi:hypothetical protein
MANYRIIYNVVIYSLVGQKTLDNTNWMSRYLSEVLRLGKGGGGVLRSGCNNCPGSLTISLEVMI